MAVEKDIDAPLVARAQRGDLSAFNLLVLKYQRRVLRLVSRLVPHPGEAEEVAQEVFLRMYRNLHLFRGDSRFYTWLHRVTINTAHSWLKSSSNKLPLVQTEIIDATELFPQNERLKDEHTPEAQVLQQQMVQLVQNALDELPDDLSKAFLLREVEGLSYDDIAQTTKVPVGTVRSRIFRAREAIAKKLQAHLGERVR